jgi:uncharacterized protein (TIGR00369 family)
LPEPTRSAPDLIQRMVRGEVPPPPIAKLLGLELIEAGKERAVFRLAVDERYWNPMGTLHGGILCDLADAAMGCAMATTLQPDQSYTTLELAITFLKPIWKGTLTAQGRVVKRTRRVGLVECDVRDEKDSLVARAKCTCLVLEGEEAAGR